MTCYIFVELSMIKEGCHFMVWILKLDLNLEDTRLIKFCTPKSRVLGGVGGENSKLKKTSQSS